MTNLDIFNEEWNWEAVDMEAKLGGIRIGPLKPLGMPTIEEANIPEDEETLLQEEITLRQRLAHLLKQKKERNVKSREHRTHANFAGKQQAVH